MTVTLPVMQPAEIDITSPWDNRVVGRVTLTPADKIPELMERARIGARVSRSLSRAERAKILIGAANAIRHAAEDFATLIVAEAGKTITQARKEVARCVNTLTLSGEEAKRLAGEVLPFDAFTGSEGRQGWYTREPLGIITAITPFNDPLNLVAHKLGPAIAGGNAVLLKPSELAPLSALRLVEALRAAGLPDTVVTVAVGGPDLGAGLTSATDVRMVSFTGGFRTGEAIARTAGLRKLAMDLGGNAPVIILEDADLESAVPACVSGAFWAAGQNCIGAQRILIARPIYKRFRDAFIARTEALRAGDPSDPKTDMGPMISTASAIRAETLVQKAVEAGAGLLAGGTRNGALVAPTVLETVPHDCPIWAEEVFAPIAMLEPFDDNEEALRIANAVPYSLHAGVFTEGLNMALQFAEGIEAGGVMVNDSSDYRLDAMPFGGFKYGSLGREGVRFALEEMTQPKVICINRAR